MPCFKFGSPAPAIRCKPEIKSVWSSWSNGSHRSWFGIYSSFAGADGFSDSKGPSPVETKGGWAEEGRTRYSHDCWFSCRGAVNAVPDSFSAYKPRGGFWGEF